MSRWGWEGYKAGASKAIGEREETETLRRRERERDGKEERRGAERGGEGRRGEGDVRETARDIDRQGEGAVEEVGEGRERGRNGREIGRESRQETFCQSIDQITKSRNWNCFLNTPIAISSMGNRIVKTEDLCDRMVSDLDALKKMRVVNRNGRLDWDDEHSVIFHSKMNLISNRLMNDSFVMEKKKQKTLQRKIGRIASFSKIKQKKTASRTVSFSDDVISFIIFNNTTMDILELLHGEGFDEHTEFEKSPRQKLPKDCDYVSFCV
eukprot:766746-Hanusia_phi.AAC.3